MKKFIALVCALTMTCMVAAGCSNSEKDSSSEAKTTTSATEEEKSSAVDEATDEAAAIEDTLTYSVVQAMNAKKFSIDMVVTSDLTGEIPVAMTMDGNNYYMMMDMSAMGSTKLEMYAVDGNAYIVDTANKTYMSTVADESSAISSVGLGESNLDGYKIISTETVDGQICESFSYNLSSSIELGSGVTLDTDSASSDSEGMTSTITYYYNADTKALEKITTESMGTTSTILVNSFSTDVSGVELPDFTGWTEQSADALISGSADSTADSATM